MQAVTERPAGTATGDDGGELLRERNPSAWGAFYEGTVDVVYGYLRTRLGVGDRVKDVLQQTYLEALRGIGRWDPERGDARAWLFGIARRQSSAAMRSDRRRAEAWRRAAADLVLEPDTSPVSGEVEDGRAAVVRAAFLSLPEGTAALLRAKYLEGGSIRALAQARGMSEKAVESALTRAREALAEAVRCERGVES